MRLSEVTVVPANSVLMPDFKSWYERLPSAVQDLVHKKYHRWRTEPGSLNFEPKFGNWYAVELDRKYHAVCTVSGNVVRWYWVGSYNDYTRFLDAARRRPRHESTRELLRRFSERRQAK